MIGVRAVRRAGPTLWGWLVAVCAIVLTHSPLYAQVPDTIPADTTVVDGAAEPIVPDGVPADTLAADTLPVDSVARDSAIRVPPFPRFPTPRTGGWAFGRWEWNRDDLLRYHSLSLLDLLERVPGVVAFRVGDFGQPAGLAALGQGGSRIRVYLDGFELDPLGFTTADLQQVALGDLDQVRVERQLDGIRVDLTPIRLPDPRPLSAIEAATGLYDTKLLRGLLVRGIGGRAVLTAAFDQSTSRGFGFENAFTYRAARTSLSYALGERTALQVDYRSELAKSGGAAAPFEGSRRTVILRGRTELSRGFTLDVMAGTISRDPANVDPLDVKLTSQQGAVRAAYDLGRLWLEASARMRTDPDLGAEPGSEFEGRAAFQPLPWLAVMGQARSAEIQGVSGTDGTGTVRVGPFAGVTAFASTGFGSQALAMVRDTAIVPVFDVPYTGDFDVRVEPRYSAVSSTSGGMRAGAEWALPGGAVGAAAVALPAGRSVPFGFYGMDRGLAPVEVETARGIEAFASLPVPGTREILRVDGWYTRWTDRGGRPYLPEQSGRVALQARGLFFRGELEPTLRVEAVHHGRALVPDADGTGFTAESLPYTLANLNLEIRILDIRAFLVFDNITGFRSAADLPGHLLPGGRLYYGLRWTFRN